MSKNFVISEDNKNFNDFSSFDHNFDQFENFIQQITMLKTQIKRLFKFVAEKSNDFSNFSDDFEKKLKNNDNINADDRVLHFDFHFDAIITNMSSKRFKRKKILLEKKRFNEF